MNELNLKTQEEKSQLSGTYNIISDNSNIVINNNCLNYGKSSILNTNNANTIISNNKYFIGGDVKLDNNNIDLVLSGTLVDDETASLPLNINTNGVLQIPDLSFEKIPNVLTTYQDIDIQNALITQVPYEFVISDETSSLFELNFKNISAEYFNNISGELYVAQSGTILNNLVTDNIIKNDSSLNTGIVNSLLDDYTNKKLNKNNLLIAYKTATNKDLSEAINEVNYSDLVKTYQNDVITDFIKNHNNSTNCFNKSKDFFKGVSGNIFKTIQGNLPSYLDTNINNLIETPVSGKFIENTSATIISDNILKIDLNLTDFSLGFGNDGIFDFYGETVDLGETEFTCTSGTVVATNKTVNINNVSKTFTQYYPITLTGNFTSPFKGVLSGNVYTTGAINFTEENYYELSTVNSNNFIPKKLYDMAIDATYNEFLSGDIYSIETNLINDAVSAIINNGYANLTDNISETTKNKFNSNVLILEDNYIAIAGSGNIYKPVYDYINTYINGSLNPTVNNNKDIENYNVNVNLLDTGLDAYILHNYDANILKTLNTIIIDQFKADFNNNFSALSANMTEAEFMPITNVILNSFETNNIEYVKNKYISESVEKFKGNYIRSGEFKVYDVDFIPTSNKLSGKYTVSGVLNRLSSDNNTSAMINYVCSGDFLKNIKYNNDDILEHIVTNTEASKVSLLDNTILPNIDSTITLSNKGAITNFPSISSNTGNKGTLTDYINVSSDGIYTTTAYWSKQLVTNGDITDWSKAKYTDKFYKNDNSELKELEELKGKITDDILNSNDFILYVTNIADTNQVEKINKILEALPKNLYRRNIRIYFALTATTNSNVFWLSDVLKIKDFYNGNIYIENISSDKTIPFSCNSNNCEIFNIQNCDSVTIKNMVFKSSLSEFTDFAELPKDLYLVYLENIKQCNIIDCDLNNVVPRNLNFNREYQINYSTYSDNILFYDTYSLIYCKNSNLTLTDIILRKSNIGVIATLNSTVNYEGTTKIEFYGYCDKDTYDKLLVGKSKFFGFSNSDNTYTGFNQGPFYDNTISIITEDTIGDGNVLRAETPLQLEFDFNNPTIFESGTNYEKLYWLPVSMTLDKFQNIVYLQSMVNYAAENSSITMFPYANIYNIAYAGNKQLNSKDVEDEFNYLLGNQQLGSLFNHTHVPMNLTIDSATSDKRKEILDRLQKKLDEAKTYKFDSFPGMMSRQFAGSLFELNDPNESIGYQYIDVSGNNNVLPIGQYIQEKYVNGYNTPFKNSLQNITNNRINYKTDNINGNSAIPYEKVGMGWILSSYITNSPEIYNIGNFWTSKLENTNFEYNLNLFNNNSNDLSRRIDNAISSLISLNGEDMLAVSIFQNYFSKNDMGVSTTITEPWNYENTDNAVPIGLWSHPVKYVTETNSTNEIINESLAPTTFTLSDRYNKAVRDTFNLNDIIVKDVFTSNYWSGKSNPTESISTNYKPNFGNTVFFYDRNIALMKYNLKYTTETDNNIILSGYNKCLSVNDYKTSNIISRTLDLSNIKIDVDINHNESIIGFYDAQNNTNIFKDDKVYNLGEAKQQIITNTSDDLFEYLSGNLDFIFDKIVLSTNTPTVNGYDDSDDSDGKPKFSSLILQISLINENNGQVITGFKEIFDYTITTVDDFTDNQFFKYITKYGMCGKDVNNSDIIWGVNDETEIPPQLLNTMIPDINTQYDFNMPYIRTCEYFGYNPAHNIKLCEGVRMPYNFYGITDGITDNNIEMASAIIASATLDTNIWPDNNDWNNPTEFNKGYKYNGQFKTPMYVKTNYFTMTPEIINRFGDNTGRYTAPTEIPDTSILTADFIEDNNIKGTVINIIGIDKPTIENQNAYDGKAFENKVVNLVKLEQEEKEENNTLTNQEMILG